MKPKSKDEVIEPPKVKRGLGIYFQNKGVNEI